MPLIDLIIQDLHKEINDHLDEAFTGDGADGAYNAGVVDASEGAEAYLRKIFPDN